MGQESKRLARQGQAVEGGVIYLNTLCSICSYRRQGSGSASPYGALDCSSYADAFLCSRVVFPQLSSDDDSCAKQTSFPHSNALSGIILSKADKTC